jgi:hypothetical protein
MSRIVAATLIRNRHKIAQTVDSQLRILSNA